MSDRRGTPWRVFISHTSELRRFPEEDRSFVAAAEAAIIRAGHVIVDMKYFPAADRSALEACQEQVGGADVQVVLAGFRYGSSVSGALEPSYTEMEFEVAVNAGLHQLVFLLGEDAQGPAALFLDPMGGHRQLRFRERLQRERVTATFTSPAELEAAVLHALFSLSDLGVLRSGVHSTIGSVSVTGSEGVQIGDGNVQHNSFGGA